MCGLWAAIHDDSVELLAEERGRRILLVCSDGPASGNWHRLEEAAEFTVDRAVAIYAVAPFASRQIRQDSQHGGDGPAGGRPRIG